MVINIGTNGATERAHNGTLSTELLAFGNKIMKKTVLALSLLALAGSAGATDFYINTDDGVGGGNYDVGGAGKVCATCTSSKNEASFLYESDTLITDLDANGIDVGDSVKTSGGLGTGGLSDAVSYGFNKFTTLSPSSAAASSNGFGPGGGVGDWQLSLSFSGLEGTINYYQNIGGDPFDGIGITYAPVGSVELYFSTDETTFYNFMDLEIMGGGTGIGNTGLLAKADFSDVDVLTDIDPTNNWMVDLFNTTDAYCGGLHSFYAIWSTCDGTTEPLLDISFLGDFNTWPITIGAPVMNGDGQYVFPVDGRHDGSLTVGIPEPSILALFGGSLLLMGFAGRRRSKKA